MKSFHEQEQFELAMVERVTGVKSTTLRQWETRGIYVCELRRQAEFNLHLICAPDTPKRLPAAKDILARYERGWRAYVLSDLIRILLIRRLMGLGLPGQIAGHAAMTSYLPEAATNITPSGRDLLRSLCDPSVPDEYLVHSRSSPVPHCFRDEPLPKTELGLAFWRNPFAHIKEFAASEGCVVVNLSSIKREVLSKIEAGEVQA